jgi:glutamine amidotransferase
MSSVAVIDYGMGNLHSITKALQLADPRVKVMVTSDHQTLLAADRVVFPGVGAIRDCMNALTQRELIPILQQAAVSKPFLGVCLGMQALLEDSEENQGTTCLGIIPGSVIRFAEGRIDTEGSTLKIPHMGWNRVHPLKSHPLWEGIAPGSWFYFVHSYFVKPTEDTDIAATTPYPDPFVSAILHENIFAVQFHPEKSQITGLRLLANFLAWDPERQAPVS